MFLVILHAVTQEPRLFSQCGSAVFHMFSLVAKERSWRVVHGMYLEGLPITFTQISMVRIQSCASINCAREAECVLEIQTNCALGKQKIGLVKS